MKKLLSSLVVGSLLLTACGSGGDSKPEKERFIDASVEVACMVFESGDAFDPNIDWEAKTKAVFADHGFDVEDDAAMEAIAAKYENDPDIEAALEAAMQECAGDLMKALEGLGDLEMEVDSDAELMEEEDDAVMEEDDAVEEEEVVEEDAAVEEEV
ncbi:MAG: hypothetical protein O3B47_02985 [bacterium]|nr:hypothetical protein [bacterium]